MRGETWFMCRVLWSASKGVFPEESFRDSVILHSGKMYGMLKWLWFLVLAACGHEEHVIGEQEMKQDHFVA